MKKHTADPRLLKSSLFGSWIGQARLWIPAVVLLLAMVGVHLLGATWLHVPVALAIVGVPGFLLTHLTGPLTARPVERLALAMVAGVAWLFAVGFGATTLLPLLGVDRPLDAAPLFGTYTVSLAALLLLAVRRPVIARTAASS